jgi:glycine cleavage system regulatory protein
MQLTRAVGLPSNLEIANLRHHLLQKLSETLDTDVLLGK